MPLKQISRRAKCLKTLKSPRPGDTGTDRVESINVRETVLARGFSFLVKNCQLIPLMCEKRVHPSLSARVPPQRPIPIGKRDRLGQTLRPRSRSEPGPMPAGSPYRQAGSTSLELRPWPRCSWVNTPTARSCLHTRSSRRGSDPGREEKQRL